MASGRTKGFWRRARNGLLNPDQVMAVDVGLRMTSAKSRALWPTRSPGRGHTPGAVGGAGQARRPDGSRDAYGNFRSVW